MTLSKLHKTVLFWIYGALFIIVLILYFDEDYNNVIEFEYMIATPIMMKKIEKQIKRAKKNITNLPINYKYPDRLPTDLKFIIKWTNSLSPYMKIFTSGQAPFIERNCKFINCFITTDSNLLVDYRNFDAIIFEHENECGDVPFIRSPHQRYIFVGPEYGGEPICNSQMDVFFNITWTYKLDSDLRWPHITILNRKGEEVGPKINMNWTESREPISEELTEKLRTKRKAAAWFVSNCVSKSGRNEVALNLMNAFKKYNLDFHIYGWCGNMTCPKHSSDDCLKVVETEYYFYLAFENVMYEDYVTEKLLHPLQHYTVPIVFGGADYSRFLPPGSYLNAKTQNAETIAFLVNEAVRNKSNYYEYFRWHKHYKYSAYPPVSDLCTLCEMMNQPITVSRVKNFRKWWYPDFKNLCVSHYVTNVEHYEKFPKLF